MLNNALLTSGSPCLKRPAKYFKNTTVVYTIICIGALQYFMMTSRTRCTPFCSPCDKHYKHHELLVALLEIDPHLNSTKQPDHDHLTKLIKKYEATGWDKNSAIMEKNEEFSFPLIHWACVLGKPKTVTWLLDNGFKPTAQSVLTKETALHRCLLTLPDLAVKRYGKSNIFIAMLSRLKTCLKIGDHRHDTPLHMAAKFMMRNKNFIFYESSLALMVKEIHRMSEEEQNLVLNALNVTGDTVLHILATHNRSYYAVQLLIDSGADPLIVNKLNCSALDTAIQNGAVRLVNLLKSALLQKVWKGKRPSPAQQQSDESSKKRRSERRSHPPLYLMEQCFPDNVEIDTSSEGSQEQSISSQRDHDEVVTSSNLDVSIGVSVIKEEHDDETCECDKDDEKEHVAVTSGEDDITPDDPATKANGDRPLLEMIQQAGVFPNLNTVIHNTRSEHSSRLDAVEKLVKEADAEIHRYEESEKLIQQDIGKLHQKLEELSSQLAIVHDNKEKVTKKRKIMQDESENLKKKMLCCEALLKSVSKNLEA